MKKKIYVYFPVIIVILFTLLAVYAPKNNKITDDEEKKAIGKPDMWIAMGKPSYESAVDSINTKVWIVTQAKHRKIMNRKMGAMMQSEKEYLDNHPKSGQIDDSTMGMDKASRNAQMQGTHFMMIDVTNTISGKEITNGSAKVQIVYPSKKSTAVDLKIIMSHFGTALTLNEKGKYLFTINVDFGGGYKTTQFKYAVK